MTPLMVDRIAGGARDQLERVILPFWLTHGVDEDAGGFFTCFDNRGYSLLSTDKYTWSQGRFVAVLARAAAAVRAGRLDADADRMLAVAEQGAEFLLRHAMRPGRTCAYVLARDGRPVPDAREADRSVYADCFVAMGFAELGAVTGADRWVAEAEAIADAATEAVVAGDPLTAPYQLPPGASGYGPLMILLNTRLDLARSASALGAPPDPGGTLAAAVEGVYGRRRADGRFIEVTEPPGAAEGLLGRHETPGHALEGLWMLAEARRLLGYGGADDDLVASALAILDVGWDRQEGGLFRYVDRDGGQPRGTPREDPYEQLIERTWDTKLWWVHTEAVVTAALLARRTGSSELATWRDRLWDWTIGTFPGRDDGREWVQIRDRRGQPLDEVVALPVKDPYHVTRNLLQLIELADEPDRTARGTKERTR